jgi:rod shape-determining protein MreD
MKKWTVVVFIILIFVLQFSVLGAFIKAGRIPNLFVALAVSMVVLFGFEKSVPWILLAGLFMDSGSSWLIGSGTLVLVLISWLVDKLKIIAELRSKRYLFAFLLAFLIFISSVIFDFLIFLLVKFEKQLGANDTANLGIMANFDYLAKLIYSVFFGIAVYYFVRKFKTQRNSGILLRK